MRSSSAVERARRSSRGDNQDIVGTQLLKQPLQRGPLPGGTGDLLLKQTATPRLVQPRALQIKPLILSRDASVAELHFWASDGVRNLSHKDAIPHTTFARHKSRVFGPRPDPRRNPEFRTPCRAAFCPTEQRARYGRYTGDPTEEQLARHFHLDATDHELVGQMRGAHNRVGFAVQLGTARFLGAFLDDPTHAPFLVTATIARQLSEVPAPSLDAYRDGRQRWRHIAIIRERYGFPRPGGGRRRRLSADPLALCTVLDWG